MKRKPTIAQRFAGFFALAALALAHVWPMRVFLNRIAGEPPKGVVDLFLGVWGALVLLWAAVIVALKYGPTVICLVWKALRWVHWTVMGGSEASKEEYRWEDQS